MGGGGSLFLFFPSSFCQELDESREGNKNNVCARACVRACVRVCVRA